MQLADIKPLIPNELYKILEGDVKELRPVQEKAIKAGLFSNKNLIVCTPTASGKTLVAEMVCAKNIIEGYGKAVYIVPLKALATEKYNNFRQRYNHLFKVALAIGDPDSEDLYLKDYDMVVCTSEKLDSLIRHHASWLRDVATIIVDEIHLLNDVSRGPTLEILLTVLKRQLRNTQIIGLSATIGNPRELAEWLGAELITDSWRPVPLYKGVYLNGEVEFDAHQPQK